MQNCKKEKEEKIQLLEEYSSRVQETLRFPVQKVHEIEDLPQKYIVLGYKQTHGTLYGSGKIYFLYNEECDFAFPVWATKRLDAILRDQKSMPDSKKTKDVQIYVDFVANREIGIEIRRKKYFRTKEGVERFYCPIDVLSIPNLLDTSLVDKEEEKMYKAMDPPKEQRLSYRPSIPKDRKTKLADFSEGEYVCFEYSSFQYRGRAKYVLFLGEEGRSATGFWIDEEMAKIVDDLPFAPMLCKVGKMARTRNGHKGRKIVFCIAEATPTNLCIAEEEQETPTNPCIAEEKQETPPNPHILEEKQEISTNPCIAEEKQETPTNPCTKGCFAYTYCPGKRKVFVPPVPTRDTIRTEEESLGDSIDRVFLEMWGGRTKSTSLHVEKDRLQKWKGLLEARV